MAELDFAAIRQRAEQALTSRWRFGSETAVAAQAERADYLAGDVRDLLDYLDAYEKALKPLRGKTFTFVPGLEILNTVTGPTCEQLQARIDELEADVAKLETELFSANQRKWSWE